MPERSTYIAGRKPVLEGLQEKANFDFILLQRGVSDSDEILAICKQNKIRFRFTDKKKLDTLFSGNHQGFLARQTAVAFATPQTAATSTLQTPFPVMLALDQIQDTGNVGTLARTLFAFGGSSILVPKNRSAFLGTGAMKASAGTLRKIQVAQTVNLGRELLACKKQGFTIYAAALQKNSTNLYETKLQFPAVLVLGNEEKGIRQGITQKCDYICHIPLPSGFDSLNVAQAGAIFLGEFFRQQNK